METYKLKDFKGGWFIGDFEPSLLKTTEVEVSIKVHPKGEQWPTHYHKKATEYNVIISGKMYLQDTYLKEGDVFILKPFEIADPEFIEDTKIVCVKVPGAKNDKFEL